VFWAATKAIESLPAEEPQFAWLAKGASGRWADNNGLVIREYGMAEGVLAIALFLRFADVNSDGGK
jgi:hypothetical protein